MSNKITFVDSAGALNEICSLFKRSAWLAVDTEFERINTYYPELCLMQILADETVAVIDPIAIADLEPLYAVLYNPAIIKVFHAARQDLELLYHLRGAVPMPVFDTQVAANLHGYSDQIGYANLVREVLDVDLPKTQTRTNWKRRPLSPKQMEYAADDVIYLGQLYERLRVKLEETNQVAQLEEQCRALDRPALYEPDPETMWKKIKIREAKNFNGVSTRVFRQLAAWRETTARRTNKPRKWIIKDHAIVNIAKTLPGDKKTLSDIDGVDEKLVRKYGDELLAMVKSVQE